MIQKSNLDHFEYDRQSFIEQLIKEINLRIGDINVD